MSFLPTDGVQTYIDQSTSGDHIIVAGVGGKIIEVYNLMMQAQDAVIAQFWSGSSSGRKLSGPLTELEATGFTLPPVGQWLVCDTGDDLVLNLDSSVQVGGLLTYHYKDA